MHKTKNPHILLVEDYPANMLVATVIFECLGLNYDTAGDGEIAVNAVKERRFDMVLMDVQLPGMDGFTATRMIREYEKAQGLPPCPIIGLTAYGEKSDHERCLNAGMTDYLPKPLTEEALQAKLNAYLVS